ncbi:CIA30 family protein [Hyunsoonleella sp. SJ7]|uniref:CIA30 family protein n=2 Tax=Hyunsoonleella aquatilis TaxID=2762758 RepID=A0A923HAH9_9FLAO|nr:CIA30 family protein [Hyunsoonleella aquatilis]
MTQNVLVFNFNKKSDIRNWMIVDDRVMGGKSSGNFELTDEGYGKFRGEISLENNGGFSSVRYFTSPIAIVNHSEIILRIKGDGKRYQFRIKETTSQRHSYVTYFQTSGKWETLRIELKDLIPKFRGRQLDIPNFSSDFVSEIGFLFGNKKVEPFQLLVDKIELR